jgi:hypothetical protein
MLPPDFLDGLQRTANEVFPTSTDTYKKVTVLLLSWDDDPSYRTGKIREDQAQIKHLELVFSNDFGFETESYRIPKENSALALAKKLEVVESQHRRDRGLLIVFYCGNAGTIDTLERDHVHIYGPEVEFSLDDLFFFPDANALQRQRTHNSHLPPRPTLDLVPIVNWSQSQETLQFSYFDVLLILDTSYSGIALYSNRLTIQAKQSGTFEVLAASLGQNLAARGNMSCTSALIQALRDLLRQEGTFTVEQLFQKFHFNMSPSQPIYMKHSAPPGMSIKLSSLISLDVESHPQKQRIVTMDISVIQSMQDDVTIEWQTWMSDHPPQNILAVEVLSAPDSSQDIKDYDFRLQVQLQDSLFPDFDPWVRWIGRLPSTLREISIEIKPSDTSDPGDAVSTLVEDLNLNTGMREALQKVFYTKVTVLPIMWKSPNPARRERFNKVDMSICSKIEDELDEFRKELSALSKEFEGFNFKSEEIFEIPDNEDDQHCQRALRAKLRELAQEYDDRHSLVIIIYGGHGVDTTTPEGEYYGTSKEGNSIWVS